MLIIIIIIIIIVVKISRVKSYKNLKQYSWMAKGLGRRHSQMTHVAKLRWNAAKQLRVVETRIVPHCRRKRLTRFCGPNYSEILQPIRWLGPEFPMLSAEPDRQLTTTHIWPIFLMRPSRLPRPLKMPKPVVWVSKRCRHCHVPCEGLAPLPWDQCQAIRAFAITARKAGRFLRHRDSGWSKRSRDNVIEGLVPCDSAWCLIAHKGMEAPGIHLWPTATGVCSTNTKT